MSTLFDLPPAAAMLAQTTVSVSLLIALVLLIRRPFARAFGAKAAYLLWLAPAARLALAPLPGQFSLMGWLGPSSAQTASPPAPVAAFPSDTPLAPVPAATARTLDTIPLAPAQAAADPSHWMDSLNLPLILLGVLLAGSLIALGIAIWRQARFAWLIAIDSEPASPALGRRAQAIARDIGLRRVPEVRTSLLCGGPLVTGFLKPVILLPAWFEEDYTADEQGHALLHELMHVKRGDLVSLQAATLFLAAQWFNPLAHLAMRAFRSDQEAACDADVLSREDTNAHGYGATLVKTVRKSIGAPSPAAAGLPLAHAIKERLILMQQPRPTLRRRLSGAGIAALIAVAGFTLTATPQEKDTAGEKPDTETERNAEVRSYSFTTGMDGKRFVILSNPMEEAMEDFERDTAPKFKELDKRVRKIHLSMPSIQSDMDSLAALEGLSVLGGLEGLAALGDIGPDTDVKVKTEGGTITLSFDGEEIVIPLNASEEDIAAFEARMEDWAGDFEVRIEKWAEGLEADMEAWEAEFEVEMEAREEEYEALFEDGFEERMETAGARLEELVEGCEEMTGDMAIIRATDEETGKTYSAVCAAKDTSAADLRAFVEGRSDLSDEEKARFQSDGDFDQQFEFRFETRED